jgi:hypothetical protein
MLDVVVILLNDNYASTALGPIEDSTAPACYGTF